VWSGFYGAIPLHSVSGFSAGGSMAVNHLIAYSSVVEGVGVVGGSPYGCNTLPDAVNTCSGWQHNSSAMNSTIPWDDFLGFCRSYLQARAASGLIDPLSALSQKPVYLVSGTNDQTVYQPVMKAVATQFLNLSSNIKTVFDLPSNHAWLVDNITCSNPGTARPSECCGTHLTVPPIKCPVPPLALPPAPSGNVEYCHAHAAVSTTAG
jgi:hypothetical protein